MSKFKVGDRVVQDKDAGGANLVQHWNMFWRSGEGDLIDGIFIVTRVTEDKTHYSNRVGGLGPSVEHKFLKLAPLKIEDGKFYKTSDGRKVGPMTWNDGRWFVRGALGTWNHDGTASHHHKPTANDFGDLVAEWIAEPAVADNSVMMPKFKVGDRVRHARIKRCSNGEITGVLPWGRYRVNWRNDLGTCVDPAEILELVTPASAEPTAIVCLIENSQPKPSVNPFVHAGAEAAATEAKRLAGKYRGKKFGVYVLQSTEEQAAPSYSHEWQRLAAKGEKISAIKELRALTGMQLKPAKDVVEHFVDYPYGAAA